MSFQFVQMEPEVHKEMKLKPCAGFQLTTRHLTAWAQGDRYF